MESFDLRQWKPSIAAGGSPSSAAIIDQITIDSRRIHSANALFIALQGSRMDGHCFVAHAAEAGAKYAIVKKTWKAPPLPQNIRLFPVEDPVRAFQDISQLYRHHLPCQVLTIIGSYGKTMVKDLLLAMLLPSRRAVASPESFNSQIGVPLSLLHINKHHDIALIEMAFSKVNEIETLANAACPEYCLLTHIGKKHIATLGSLEQTAAEMVKCLQKIPETGWCLLPGDPLLEPYLPTIKGKCFFWNAENRELPHARALVLERTQSIPCRIDFPDGHVWEKEITARHDYALDLLNMTTKAAWLLGASSANICSALNDGLPEPMRTEIWQSPTGATVVNDTYCSDPLSVDLALRHFDRCLPSTKKIVIFGGLRGESEHHANDYQRIGKAIHQVDPHLLILVGRHPFQPLIEEIKRLAPTQQFLHAASYEQAFQSIRHQVGAEHMILIKGERRPSLDSVFEAFHGSICTNQCRIHLTAIATNLAAIRQKIGENTRIMAMIKASAYGTDDVGMARFLDTQGVDIVGVSYVDEGIALKRAGINQNIFVLNTATYEAAKVVEWGLEVGVSDKDAILAIAEKAKEAFPIKVHLHVDTGMGRLGCRPENALPLAQLIQSVPALKLEGIMTHFACADNRKEDAFTLAQLRTFDTVLEELSSAEISVPWRHAANSSAMMRFHFPQLNMVRIGLALYGLNPFKEKEHSLNLRPALSLHSRIVGINVCKKGETVSYGRNYRIEKQQQRIGVIPFGYFDGLHRHYSGKGCVIVRGQEAPMVGSICMDYLMVDISHIPKASVGDPVLVFGKDDCGNYLAPEELAERGQSIVHELVTCLGPRIQRIFIHEETPQSC
ncbi:MAG: alanine racemase [Waddliaceae bacterium]